MVTVQNPEAPRREDEQTRPWKQHANELDGQLALLAAESRSNQGNHQRRRRDADENKNGDYQREERRHRPGYSIRIPLTGTREEPGIDRDERRRQRSFSEQVLKKIRNP